MLNVSMTKYNQMVVRREGGPDLLDVAEEKEKEKKKGIKDAFNFFGQSKPNNEVTRTERRKMMRRTVLRRHFYKGRQKFGFGNVHLVCLFIRQVVMLSEMLGR